MLHKSVGTNDDEEANDTLEQTNGAGLGEVEAVHHGAVYVGLNDVRGLEEHGVVANQVVEQTEVTLEDAADGKQEEDHHGGFQRGQRDVTNTLETIGTVNLCRLHHGGIHTGNGRKVDYGAITSSLPQVDQHNDKRPGIGHLVNLGHFAAHGTNQVGNEAVVVVEQIIHQQGNQHVRNEVRQEHHGLRGLFVALGLHFIQQNGKKQLQKVSQHDERHIVQDRVAQQQGQLP